MSLAAGRRVGPYEVLSALGKGGMGEVYRARDTKLNREVALKVLPASLANDPDRLARFQREAQVLASLNHPNIGAIYGFEDCDGIKALVLELVEGPTLADRIVKGKIALDEAIAISKQICEAIETAHAQGVVHRDLKPANIKLRPDGTVKVLDFGLAKLIASQSAQAADSSGSMARTITGVEVIVGTAAYMSPEQAKGREADKRSDVWAFGCILFEMLSQKRPFSGETTTEILANVIHTEPKWDAIASAPPTVRRIVRRCLNKDPHNRLHDLGDARLDMEEALTGASDSPVITVAPGAATHKIAWAVAALMFVVAAGSVWWAWRGARPGPTLRVVANTTSGAALTVGRGSSVALSPDGRWLAYTATLDKKRQIYLRELDHLDSSAVIGTEGASEPFFSPDGQWIGFFADGKLKKVRREGGESTTLADAPNPRGEYWGADDHIYFTPRNNAAIWKVAVNGSTPAVQVTHLGQGELSHRWPQLLPNGALLFTVWNDNGFEGGKISAHKPGAQSHEFVLAGGGYPRCVGPDSSGRYFLLFAQLDRLTAIQFDPDKLKTIGDAFPTGERVLTNLSGGAHFDSSANGLLAYLQGSTQEQERTLLSVEMAGGKSTTIGKIRAMSLDFSLSPDAKQLVRANSYGTSRDLWIEDLERGTSSRFTYTGASRPVWSRDGQWIAYISGFPSGNIFRKRADGSGAEERLTSGPRGQFPGSFSPDGKSLVFMESDPATSTDIYLLPIDGDRKPVPLVKTPFSEGLARVSPDGKWMAYQSNETGRMEAYVIPFPNGGRKVQISNEGAYDLTWSPDGRVIYYQSNTGIMAAEISAKPELTVQRPHKIMDGFYDGALTVFPDGKRFLLYEPLKQEARSQINIVSNWFEELRRAAPAPK